MTDTSTGAGELDATAATSLDREHRGITLGLLALVTMFAFEAVAVSVAMPSVARDLDGHALYPVAVIGMLTSALVGMVVGGAWGDARGARGPVLVGGLGFVVGLVVSGLAGSMDVFVLGRLVQGLGCGAAMTGMYVAVADAFAPDLRTKVFSLFATAWVLPSVVGPFVAGTLVDLAGWRSVFLVVAAFAALSTVTVSTAMRGRVARRDAVIAWGVRPALATVAAVGALLLHLAGQFPELVAVGLVLVGLALLTVAVPRLLPAGTLRGRPGLPAVILLRGLLGAAFAGVEMFLPLLLQGESGLSPTLAGLVMMVAALGWTAGSAWSGRHATPATEQRLLRAGAAAVLLGATVLLVVVPLEHHAWLASGAAVVGFSVIAVGMGLNTPLLSTLALDLAAPGRQGASGADVQMSDALGQSVAAGAIGVVFAHWYAADHGTSYLSGFGIAVLLAATGLAVVRRIRR